MLITEKDRMVMKLIYWDLKYMFVITQILFASPFLIGVLFEKSTMSMIISVSINFIFISIFIILIQVVMMFYYKQIKEKKNYSLFALIVIFCYISIILSFVLYTTFFNLSSIIFSNFSTEGLRRILSVTSHSLYCLSAVTLLSYFKDIVFAVVFEYIATGYLLSPQKLEKSEIICASVTIGFTFAAIFVTICKYGKDTLGYENDSETNSMLVKHAHHKASCIS